MDAAQAIADLTEISPQIELRQRLDLYAGLRPIRAIPGVPSALADPRAAAIDFVLLRESTEGLFHSMGRGVVTEDYAEETLTAAIDWGRYAELYSFDDEADQFYLDEE